MKAERRIFNQVIRVGVALLFVLSPSITKAYTITMSSPSVGSNWSTGSGTTLTVTGLVTWDVDTEDFVFEAQPDSVVIYIHAGGTGGTVTNSGNATISNVTQPTDPGTGSESYNGTLALTAATPPVGGGNGAYAKYYIEAHAFFQGGQVPGAGPGGLFIMNQINAQNG